MEKVKVMPGLLAAPAFLAASASWGRGGRGGADVMFVGRLRPVRREIAERTARLRQRIVRLTRAGRECQVKIIVPRTKTRRLVVMIRSGGSVSAIQMGVNAKIRINSVVNAGLVVADVALDWVERYSVNPKKGSKITSQRPVKLCSVSSISSRLFRCSESARFLFLSTPLQRVLDNGEYLLEYMPIIKPATNTTGPAHRSTSSPYSTTNQKHTTSRKLSQGSSVVQLRSPTRWFSGRMKG
jgi:hypothetical protein